MASISALESVLNATAISLGTAFTDKRRKRIAPLSSTESGRYCYPIFSSLNNASSSIGGGEIFKRRDVALSMIGFLAGAFCHSTNTELAGASEFADMPLLEERIMGRQKCGTQTTLKQNQVSSLRSPVGKNLWEFTFNFHMHNAVTKMEFNSEFKGMQDLRVGSGPTPKMGDTVVVDWDGYTIGYYGRIFEARNKTKGGSFEGSDKDFFKFRIGLQQVIPAFEEAVSGMAVGSIRRVIVPPELGYPENDFNKMGPRPTTFSGQRALDFVLRNQGLIDKTLLFDIELLKIIPN